MQQTQKETINLHNSVPHIDFTNCSNFTVNFNNNKPNEYNNNKPNE